MNSNSEVKIVNVCLGLLLLFEHAKSIISCANCKNKVLELAVKVIYIGILKDDHYTLYFVWYVLLTLTKKCAIFECLLVWF